MSDISIPGFSSNINTDKIIADLMKLQRIPLNRLKDRLATDKKERDAWVELNRYIGTVRDSAKALYGFDNPFEDKVAASSDSSALSATAARTARQASDTVTVERLATSDSFLSASLPDDYAVPPGTYGFTVGKKELSMQFGGGSLSDFAQFVTQHSQGLLDASVVDDTPSTQVFAIKANPTGAENKLAFTKDSVRFGVGAGIIRGTSTTERTVGLTPGEVQQWTKPLTSELFSLGNGVLTLKPGGEAALPISPPVAAAKGLVIELTVTVNHLPESAAAQAAAPAGPSIPATGTIEYQGIKIQSSPSQAPLPPWTPPPPPKRVDDLGVLFLQDGAKTVKLPDIQDGTGPQTIQIPLSEYVQNLSSLDVRNNNTYREIQIAGIKIYDPKARGRYAPVNPVSQAADAKLNLDGIKVTRKSNTIDDLIPGVTLKLKAPSSGPVALTIGPDTKRIKNAIIDFVGNYDKLLTDIEIYTNRDPAVIDEITYFSPEERAAAKAKQGLFEGDITLEQLKSHLEEIMMDPYKTEAGRAMTLLAQIGISTDTSNLADGFDASKLRGYLEIDDGKLDNALATELQPLRELFGYDSTGDLVIDSGAAYATDRYLQAFNETGGIIPGMLQSYDQEIASTNQDISTMNDKLADKERELRDKYSEMEGTINTLQQNSKSIGALGSQQPQPGQ